VSSNNLLSKQSVAGIIMNCHDVTEHNQIQDALQTSEERFSLAVRGANDGIWDWDLRRDEIYVSPRWMAMLGQGDDTLTIEPSWWLERVHPEDREDFEACFNGHRLGHTQLLEHEYRMQHSDGGYRWMQTRGIAVRDESGEPHRIAGSQTDVTARRQQQAQLEEARRKALDASRAKGEFLANMSHEIRTPMNGVIGMASLLLETDLDAKQRDFVETIQVSGDALLTIVNDILDLSKIESGKLEIEAVEIDLRACIESAIDLVAPVAAEKGLELAYLFSEGVPEVLLGDATRIRQILVNLLGNAIKFTESGGAAISVRATPADSEQLEIQLSVRDTGIGIDADSVRTLFDPFSQADASITRRYGGTGLGLAICKRLTELMGGCIWIESTPGEGSTFHFTIVTQPRPAEAQGGQALELPGRRLLLVDDNPLLREALAQQFDAWSADIRIAESGTEALAILAEDPGFDAALIDLDMPEMDGVVLARAIRGLPQGRELPLVLLIPMGADRGRQQAADDLVNATVAKPIKPGRVYDALADVIDDVVPRPEALAERGRADDDALPQLRILLAEDNPVNQKVAMLMLDRLGYKPDLAADGSEVLAALDKARYDVILMDVQMPNVDGIEATRRIRASDNQSDVRIIAMTAHALEGDRERCLEAGMDGYLTKPVQMADLRNIFLGIRPQAPGPEVEPVQAKAPARPAVLDKERIAELRSFADCGQVGLLRALVDTFLEAAPGQLAAVQEAAEARDGDAIKRSAHQLKGGALNLGASTVVRTCKALEAAGQSGVFDELDALVDELDRELARAGEALSELAAEDR
jgi:PAS domain S-box-containing protein